MAEIACLVCCILDVCGNAVVADGGVG